MHVAPKRVRKARRFVQNSVLNPVSARATARCLDLDRRRGVAWGAVRWGEGADSLVPVSCPVSFLFVFSVCLSAQKSEEKALEEG
eukprot:4838120-Pyramimonas_sp.AAC.1